MSSWRQITPSFAQQSDNFEETIRKMEALTAVVKQGKSLAIHTVSARAAHQTRDPEELAKRAMTPRELRQYNAWRDGNRIAPKLTVSNRSEPLALANRPPKGWSSARRP